MNIKNINNYKSMFIILTPLVLLVTLLSVTYFITYELDIQRKDDTIFYNKYRAKEYYWRMVWASLFVIIIFLSAVNSWHSIKIIINHISDMENSIKIKIALMIGLLVSGLLYLLGNGGYFGSVKDLLDKSTFFFERVSMQKYVDVLFIITSITGVMITLSSGALMYCKGNLDLKRLKEKIRDFKRSFYLTSIYLGLAIIQFFSLSTWSSFASGVDESHYKIIHAITLSSSLLYTMVFVIIFVPVSIRIRGWIEIIVEKSDLDTPEKIKKWKVEEGLYDSPGNNIRQLLILLSPVLIGFISSFIGK